MFRDVTLNLHAEVEKMVVWFPSKNSTLTCESFLTDPPRPSGDNWATVTVNVVLIVVRFGCVPTMDDFGRDNRDDAGS